MEYARELKGESAASQTARDQVMAQARIYTGANAGSTLNQVRPESELESITSRVHRMATNMEEIAAKLRIHADGVYGQCSEAEAMPPAPGRSGQLGSLHDALDRLANAQSELAEQAGRNCTLA